MRNALVLLRNIPAGTLTEESPSSYVFRYLDSYLMREELPPVSLTMPKTSEEYRSPIYFPFSSTCSRKASTRKSSAVISIWMKRIISGCSLQQVMMIRLEH